MTQQSVEKIDNTYRRRVFHNVEFPFRIGDAAWIVTDELRGEIPKIGWKRIDFNLIFDDGSRFSDGRYTNMLYVVQKYLEFKWCSGNYRINSFWNRIRFFIAFLVNIRKVCCFSEAWGVDEYVAYRKKMGGLKGRGAKKPKNDGRLKADSLFRYIACVKELWHFSEGMEYGLRAEPWVGKTAAKVAGAKSNNEMNVVEPYELAVFAGFIRVARRDLENVDAVCKLLLSTTDYRVRIAAVNQLRTSAALAICATEGMRPDEIYSLDVNCLENGKLNTEDGFVDVTWLNGRIFKGEPPSGRPHRWLASEETILAVSALNKVRRALDLAVKHGRIPPSDAPAIEQSKGLLFPKFRYLNGNKAFNPRAALIAIKKYIQRPECMEFLTDDTVVTHQRFRPTIARAFARLKLGDVTYFKSHFGHTSSKTTRGYFLTFADDELQADADNYINSESQNILHEILSSPFPLEGGRGRELEPLRREYPVMTFESKKALLRTLQRGHQIRIGPQSLCLARRGRALCSQDCLYEQESCLDCENGVLTNQHLPVWKDMLERNQEVLRELPVGSPGNDAISANQIEIKAAVKRLGRKPRS
ncbi:hypothetical protein [Paraburkholderia sp. J7]|uniref:hypothetical protein n=1 Tax=Paraburkholderia sp. J7 TaxID=2805438 RepID=UPI002AB66ADF|nr:hypothetical protein [Paraburkholderia sp. J7]